MSASPGGSASPTITAHAINTKGTGVNSGRMSSEVKVKNQLPIGIDCVSSQWTGDAAAQKVAYSDIHFTSRGAKSVGWSCSVSGSEEQPVFSVGLLVPTILGQAERASWGVGRGILPMSMSIVGRSAVQSGSWNVACVSKEPRRAGFSLVMSNADRSIIPRPKGSGRQSH